MKVSDRSLLLCLVACSLPIILSAFWGLWVLGDSRAVLHVLDSETLYVDDSSLDLDVVASQSNSIVYFRFYNVSTHPATLVGIDSPCGCITVDDLPLQVAGRSHLDVPFHIRAPFVAKGARPFDQSFRIISDQDAAPIVVSVSGIASTVDPDG